MNDDPTMSQILEICHKFTDKDIKIELKNLVRTGILIIPSILKRFLIFKMVLI